jgi:hypothetical protein
MNPSLTSADGHETLRTRHRCIHNDHKPERTYTLKGLYAAVVWVALWSLIIVGFVSHDIRRRMPPPGHVAHSFVVYQSSVNGEMTRTGTCTKCGYREIPGITDYNCGRPRP